MRKISENTLRNIIRNTIVEAAVSYDAFQEYGKDIGNAIQSLSNLKNTLNYDELGDTRSQDKTSNLLQNTAKALNRAYVGVEVMNKTVNDRTNVGYHTPVAPQTPQVNNQANYQANGQGNSTDQTQSPNQSEYIDVPIDANDSGNYEYAQPEPEPIPEEEQAPTKIIIGNIPGGKKELPCEAGLGLTDSLLSDYEIASKPSRLGMVPDTGYIHDVVDYNYFLQKGFNEIQTNMPNPTLIFIRGEKTYEEVNGPDCHVFVQNPGEQMVEIPYGSFIRVGKGSIIKSQNNATGKRFLTFTLAEGKRTKKKKLTESQLRTIISESIKEYLLNM